MAKTLITGGAGFIGSHLTRKLLAEGHHVTVLDNLCGGSLQNLDEVLHHPHFRFVSLDIRNKEALEGRFENIDWVFHLAALVGVVPSLEQPREYFDTNVSGTFNVLEAARHAKVKRFLYAASSSCYGNPQEYPTKETSPISLQTPYALTKYLGEQLVLHWAQCYQLPALTLRLFNVFGPRFSKSKGSAYDAVFEVFLSQKLRNDPYTIVGDGSQTRDFIHVSDVVEAFYIAAQSELMNDTFNVGSSKEYSINYLAQLLGGPISYVPKRPCESQRSLADISKIEQKLHWKALTSFEEGVKQLINRYLK